MYRVAIQVNHPAAECSVVFTGLPREVIGKEQLTTRTSRAAIQDRTSYERLATFRHALRKFLHFSEAASERAGITGQQYHALVVLRAYAGKRMTVNDLAAQLMLKHNSAVGLVDRLAERHLLLRRPARDDARKVDLVLTAKGGRVIERLVALHIAELRRIGGQLAEILLAISEA